MKPLVLVAGLVLAVVLATGAASGDGGSSASTPATYPAQVVADASAMTQQMSAPADPAHAYHLHSQDEQLQLSADPAFLRQLEAYQAGIDRMLAR